METTFDKFITNNAEQKALFDKEYAEFLHSERMLETLNKGRQAKSFVAKNKVSRRKLVLA